MNKKNYRSNLKHRNIKFINNQIADKCIDKDLCITNNVRLTIQN